MAYKYSYINRCGEKTYIFCRNVTAKDREAALQFEIEQQKAKRNYHHSYALPASEIPKFLKAIQKED